MRAELGAFSVESPSSLDEALEMLAASPEPLRALAGGTDLYVYLNAGTIEPGRWIDLWGLEELRGIRLDDDWLIVGALTTYSDLRASDLVARWLPLLAEASATVGAVAIQNRGTLGGNVANGSPAGDSLPPLLVYDAEIGLRSSRGKRWVPFDGYYTGYRRSVLAPDELIDEIRFPLAAVSQAGQGRFVKVGTRSAQAISKIVAAFTLARDSEGVVTRARIAYGSVAPTPIRVRGVEDALVGGRVDDARIAACLTGLQAAIAPIDDVRSSAEYRRWVSGQILRRFLEEL